MNHKPLLAIAMDHDSLLRDSQGETYDFAFDPLNDRFDLLKELENIRTKIIAKTSQNEIIILTDIVFPYSHTIPIKPKWWFEFLSGFDHSVRMVKGRGRLYTFCHICKNRVPKYLVMGEKWSCPFCLNDHVTVMNLLKNMISDYSFYEQTKKRDQQESKESKDKSVTYLFSKIASPRREIVGPYEIQTDAETKEFLQHMSYTLKNIREDILDKYEDRHVPLDYKGWVDEWYDKSGEFTKYRNNGKIRLSYVAIADSIIAMIKDINHTNTDITDVSHLWVVYWRNVHVDRKTKRITFPRMRGRYIQLPLSACIPQANCYVEICMNSTTDIQLRFVLAGNLPLKEEPIEGRYHRGRNRRTTRKPRTKFK